jgi:hypothetical protein
MTSPYHEVGEEYLTGSIPAVEPGRKGPSSIYAKFCSAALVIVAFFQAVYGDGLSAIEFWMALFYAAAMQQPADDKPSHHNRDEIRSRLIM